VNAFQYQFGNSAENFLEHTAAFLGGSAQTKLLALYHEDCNGLKQFWVTGKNVNVGGLNPTAAVNMVKNVSTLRLFQPLMFPFLYPTPTALWHSSLN